MTRVQTLASEIDRRLHAVSREHRAGSVDGHSRSSLRVLGATVPDVRALVGSVAGRIEKQSPAFVIELAGRLAHSGTLDCRQVAYELLGRRQDASARLATRAIEQLGRGNDNWKCVEIFALEVRAEGERVTPARDAGSLGRPRRHHPTAGTPGAAGSVLRGHRAAGVESGPTSPGGNRGVRREWWCHRGELVDPDG